ncbi:MAG TPA: response regulator [Pyrinomonadaceae bacterium]|jgi:CheY-like chemotaxis protein
MSAASTPAPAANRAPRAAGHYAFGQTPGQSGSMPYATGNEPVALDKPRALVVDDAPDVSEMIALLLKYAGYDVVTVYSGMQALDAARQQQFDALISDIGMPGMNGYELAEHVRALPGYERVPMIAVTGFTMYDDRDRALASGFNAFLTKPISPNDLISLLAGLRS